MVLPPDFRLRRSLTFAFAIAPYLPGEMNLRSLSYGVVPQLSHPLFVPILLGISSYVP
jgi:hypothetical protein